jgi:hypothetical protein
MKEATIVTSAIKAEVDWLRHEAMRCLKGETEWSTPISHLVDRQPDHTAYSDAYLKYGMGGYCHTLECWWQINWEELHPDIRKQIDDYVRQRFHEKCKKSVVHINPLKFSAQIITYMMCIVVLQQDAYAIPPWGAVVLLRGDNKAANAWSESYSVKNYIGRALTRLLREGEGPPECDRKGDISAVGHF